MITAPNIVNLILKICKKRKINICAFCKLHFFTIYEIIFWKYYVILGILYNCIILGILYEIINIAASH